MKRDSNIAMFSEGISISHEAGKFPSSLLLQNVMLSIQSDVWGCCSSFLRRSTSCVVDVDLAGNGSSIRDPASSKSSAFIVSIAITQWLPAGVPVSKPDCIFKYTPPHLLPLLPFWTKCWVRGHLQSSKMGWPSFDVPYSRGPVSVIS